MKLRRSLKTSALNNRSNRKIRRVKNDDGITMIELLISIIISGTLVATMSFAYSTFLRTYPTAVDRVAVSKDITFVQAWLPIDLASATQIDADPLLQPSATQPALPGTNVLTMTRIDLQDPLHPEYLVHYRYVERTAGEWVLIRYEIHNVGDASNEEVKQVGIAHELAPPPAGWDPTTAPTHAIDVTGRNPGRLRKVGNDVTVNFADGTKYDTGGAGLGPGAILSAVSADGFVNPSSPPSRCGGGMTLVLDTSGSLGDANVLKVKNSARAFVDAFQGTPTDLRILEFEGLAAPVAPATWAEAPIDMLNLTAAEATDIKDNQIGAILEDDSGWTNWEDGLRRALTDYSDLSGLQKSPEIPDTVVFFTDGIPNKYTSTGGALTPSGNSQDATTALSEAKAVSNKKGEWGVTFKGVFVPGPGLEGAERNTAIDRVKQIVGDTEWVDDGGVGNADAAEYFYTDDFDALSNIFQQIFVSDCGGTVTIQRRENSDPTDKVSNGSYEYATTTGNGLLKAAEANSITFDYELGTGASETVSIIETGATGDEIVDVQCFHNGVDVTSTRVAPLFDEDGSSIASGRDIQVRANEALSCLFIGS